ncbi:MAG: hypothetical protein IJL28_02230 [Prevotella sp.]|nr:hypothetical protein [Prevotella sp.]
MATFEITLTQFCNYLTKTSRQKATVARQIATSLAEDYQAPVDYWLHLRNGVRRAISTTGRAESLDAMMDNVPVDRQGNYQIMLDGLKRYWGNKTFDRITYRKAVWRHSRLKIRVSIELYGEYRNKVYLIKLYTHVNDSIRKDEADMMLLVMKEALQSEIQRFEEEGHEVVLGVLDVAKGKLHSYREVGEDVSTILKLEAEVLGKYLSEVMIP